MTSRTKTSRVLEALPENPFKLDAKRSARPARRAFHEDDGERGLAQLGMALLADPSSPEVLGTLADLTAAQGDLGQTAGVLQHLVEQNPEHIRGHYTLAEALVALGRTEEALMLVGRLRRLAPNDAELCLTCGGLYERAGRLALAGHAYRDAAMSQSVRDETANRAIGRLLALGRSGDAVAAAGTAQRRHTASHGISLRYIEASLADGRPSAALQAVAHARTMADETPRAALLQARALLDLGRPAQALAACRRAAGGGGDMADVNALRGVAYRFLGKLSQALTAYQEAIRAVPNNPRLRYGQAMALAASGLKKEALRALDTAAEHMPGDVEIHVSRAALLTELGEESAAREAQGLVALTGPARASEVLDAPSTLDFDLEPGVDLQGWQDILQSGCLGAGERIGIQFALGHGLEGAGYPDAAFAYWRAANAALRSRFTFDAAGFGRWLRAVPRHAAPILENPSGETPEPARHRPIFIVGMPRTGTTLVEEILGRHPDIEVGGEQSTLPELLASGEFIRRYPDDLASLDAADLKALREAYLDAVAAVSGEAAWVTDKLPGNFAHLGLIHRLFPEAVIIHCTRDPRDVAMSCFTQWFGSGHHYAYDLDELLTVLAAEREVMADWKQRLPGHRIHTVAYDKLVGDSTRTIEALFAAFGLPPHPACFQVWQEPRHVETASARRVLQPIHTRRIGRWKSHVDGLRPWLEDFAELDADAC